MATITRYPKEKGSERVQASPLPHMSDDYQRAAAYYVAKGRFDVANWYIHMYRLYSPEPPDSGVDIDLDWNVGESSK